MLHLMLFRHAKADRPADLSDHERPLAIEGHTQARQMGKYIEAEQLDPELAIVSNARRARETWAQASDAGHMTCVMSLESRIYEASLDDLLDVISRQDSKYRRIMLVGHNPGMERLTAYLAGGGTDTALSNWQKGFVVGSLAVIALPATSWSTLQAHSGWLEHFKIPSTT